MTKNYNFILIFTFFSLIGSELFIFALSFKILDSYKSAIYYSIFLILYSVMHILLSPIIGKFIDKNNKLHLILFSQMITIISVFLYLFIPDSLSNLPSIYILLILLTVTDLTVTLTFDTGLLKIVGNDLIEKTVSNRSAIEKTVSIISPIIGGTIYAFIPLNSFLLVLLFTEIFSLILVLFIKFPKYNNKDGVSQNYQEKNQNNYKKIIGYMYMNKDIMLLVILGVFINFLLSFLNVGIASSFIQYFNMSSSNLGFMQVATPIGMIFIAFMYPFLNAKSGVFKQNSQGLFIICLSIIILLIPFIIDNNFNIIFISFILARLFLGIGVQYTNIPSIVYLQKNIPENIKGIFFGTLNSSLQSAVPLGFLLAGILFDINTIFYIILFSVSGLISLILAFYSLNYNKYISKE